MINKIFGHNISHFYIVFLMLMLLLLLSACGGQNTQVLEDIQIGVTVEPDPPTVGDTTLLVSVKEADGKPIDSATVAVHADMDHEGMVPVDADISESTDGLYRVPLTWTMGGTWVLDVTVTLPNNRGIATKHLEYFVGAISQDSVIHHNNSENGITIRYNSDNDPANVGDATVTVIALSQDGLPIEDATISLHATMPEHDMMPVDAESDGSTNGRYLIPLSWTMAGEWQVEVTVTLNDTTSVSQTFNQTVVMGK